jgi:hypothetical protein
MIVSLETFTAKRSLAGAELESNRLRVRAERCPCLRVVAADVTGDDGAAFVEDRYRRVAVEAEHAGELEIWIGERGPRPAVSANERLRLALVVADVRADVLVLGWVSTNRA